MSAGIVGPDDAGSSPPTVVRLPHQIDMTNADRVGDQLIAAFCSGVHVVVADLTSTVFCDTAGVRSLIRAHRHANLERARLRLAVPPDGPVRRVLELMGLTGVLNVFPSLGDALTNKGLPHR